MNWLRRLFCAHRYEWMRNIYGDEINLSGGKRSLWGCTECGKVQARDDLHDDGDLRGIAGPLPDEGGASLRAAGFRLDKEDAGGSAAMWHSRPGRTAQPVGDDLIGGKWRWIG